MQSPPDYISSWGWGWLFPLRLPCDAHQTRSALRLGVALPFRPYLHAASSIRSFTQVCKKCSSIVNAKPTGADQPLRFSMVLPLKSSPTPLHPAEASPKPNIIFKHLKCEAHQTCSSHTKTLLAQLLHPAEASHKSGKSFRASSMRSPPDHIGR